MRLRTGGQLCVSVKRGCDSARRERDECNGCQLDRGYAQLYVEQIGTYYCLALPASDEAPDAATIKSTGLSGTLYAGAEVTAGLSGLSAATSYIAYIVVVDTAGNDSAVTEIAFTTVSVLYDTVLANYDSGYASEGAALTDYLGAGASGFCPAREQRYSFSGKYVRLTQDVDLSAFCHPADGDTPAVNWTPIGRSDTEFAGVFDGGGNTVSGLYYNGTSSDGSDSYIACSVMQRQRTREPAKSKTWKLRTRISPAIKWWARLRQCEQLRYRQQLLRQREHPRQQEFRRRHCRHVIQRNGQKLRLRGRRVFRHWLHRGRGRIFVYVGHD